MKNQIVSEARQWIGTRYQHQQHTKNLATDCGGLVYGVGLELGIFPPVADFPNVDLYMGYPRLAHNNSLRNACAVLLDPIEASDAQAGDVVLMRFDTEPQHLGILGDYAHGGFSLIHAYANARKVVEHRFDDVWLSRVVSYWRYRSIE